MTDEQKAWIDNATTYQLLRRWRFSENDEIFQGETGDYYSKVMFARRDSMSPGEWPALSKAIGWG